MKEPKLSKGDFFISLAKFKHSTEFKQAEKKISLPYFEHKNVTSKDIMFIIIWTDIFILTFFDNTWIVYVPFISSCK